MIICRQVGGTICYRCLTLIKRSSNIIQVIMKGGKYDNILQITIYFVEQFCYDSIQLARRTCINSERITPGKGIFLFSMNVRFMIEQNQLFMLESSNVRAEYCQIEGRARVAYEMRSSGFRCAPKATNGAHVSNCQQGSRLNLRLQSCTFPDMGSYHSLHSFRNCYLQK